MRPRYSFALFIFFPASATAWLTICEVSHRHFERKLKNTTIIINNYQQEILLDCDQYNVLFARIIFFCIFKKTFSFLSACIRDMASN